MKEDNQFSPAIWNYENNRLSVCKSWLKRRIESARERVSWTTNEVNRGGYEDQASFMPYSEKAQALRELKQEHSLQKSLENTPYFGRIDINDGKCVLNIYLSDSEELQQIEEMNSEEALLIPFKHDEERPLVRRLISLYTSRNPSPFEIKGYSYTVQTIREVSIENGKLEQIVCYYPVKEKNTFGTVSDELLNKRLDENRQDPKLRNIIATIQRKQFDIISAEASENFIVQGCPGSGKTQILIHRLFFLRGVLSGKDWEGVLLLTPSMLFKDYSDELLRRYQMSDITQYSLAGLYIQLLSCFDSRFVNRHYSFVLSEEYLPASFLRDIYDPSLVKQVRLAIQQAIRRRIEEGYEKLGLKFPEKNKMVFSESINILEKKNQNLKEEIDSIDDAKHDPLYQQYLQEYRELKKKEQENKERQIQLNEIIEETEQEYKRLLGLLMDRQEFTKELEYYARVNEWSEINTINNNEKNYVEIMQANVSLNIPNISDSSDDSDKATIGVKKQKGNENNDDLEYLQLFKDLIEECDQEISFIIGNHEAQDWITEYQEKTKEMRALGTRLIEEQDAIENEILQCTQQIDDFISDSGLFYSKEEIEKKKADYEWIRVMLSRLESSVFEQEVWNTLASIKEKHNVQMIQVELLKNNQKQHNRILYKADLLYYVMIYHAIRDDKQLPSYKMICIDEGQDLHPVDYHVLRQLYPKTVFNVFGDLTQVLYENCGISSWKDTKISKMYELVENYRSAPEIVEFCNEKLGCKMQSFGKRLSLVEEIDEKDLVACLRERQGSMVVIIKDKEQFEYLSSILASYMLGEYRYIDSNDTNFERDVLQIFSVYAVKGLEFEEVLVMSRGMNQNQKIVACTRATRKLVYC